MVTVYKLVGNVSCYTCGYWQCVCVVTALTILATEIISIQLSFEAVSSLPSMTFDRDAAWRENADAGEKPNSQHEYKNFGLLSLNSPYQVICKQSTGTPELRKCIDNHLIA